MSNGYTSIMDLVNRHTDDISMDIGKRLDSNEKYTESYSELEMYLQRVEQFDKKLAMNISNVIGALCSDYQDASYDQGYADAIKLIIACMK